MNTRDDVLQEFTPCGGHICTGCEVQCTNVDGRTPDPLQMADEIVQLREKIKHLAERQIHVLIEKQIFSEQRDGCQHLLKHTEAERDGAYRERNQVVAWAARMALALGFEVAVNKTEIDGWDSAWHNCVYITTPEGQVSWHFHDNDMEFFADLPRRLTSWDGHTTQQKYDRLHKATYVNYTNRALAVMEEKLAKTKRERDLLVAEYESAVGCEPQGYLHALLHIRNAIVNNMADNRILAKLREPSEEVVNALAAAAWKEDSAMISREGGPTILSAAVEAAERETTESITTE